jgi:hypothetical protein
VLREGLRRERGSGGARILGSGARGACGCAGIDRRCGRGERGSERSPRGVFVGRPNGRCSRQDRGGAQEGGSFEGRRGQLRRGHVLGQLEGADLVSAVRGVGLGLRWEFLDDLVEQTAAREAEGRGPLPVAFLEVSPENYMKRGGRYPSALSWLAERYPIVTHGLTMSLGGTDPLDDA